MTKQIPPYRRLVFPLDVDHIDRAESLAGQLSGRVGWFKIGLELFTAVGPRAVRTVRSADPEAGIFLDLKLHDIPATVGRAAAAADQLGVGLITVHAEGGPDMIRAAKQGAAQAKILAVTLLTSIDLRTDVGLRPELTDPEKLVAFRAERAFEAGVDGFVCSGHEARTIRDAVGPGPLIVTPGIRPAWSLVEGDDQKRVVTPARALEAGADLIVVGRPIRDAADPADAAGRVAAELA
jgi:orotidine-5'-phosphate decarboxylase